MKIEPDFERLRKALLCQEPDRVPTLELQIDPPVPETFLGRPSTGIRDEIEFWEKGGYDCFVLNPPNVLSELLQSLTWATSETDSSYHRTAERKWSFEHESLIAGREDLEMLPSPEPRPKDYEPVKQALRLLPDGMGLIVQLGGFFEYPWQFMGFELFSMSLADDPDLVSDLCDWVKSALMNHFNALMDFEGVSGIWLCDDIAYTEGLMVSPTFLRRHVFPNHKKIAQVGRSRGMPVIYHSDGDLTEVMDDLLDNGIHALHPIEPKALDIYDMKRRYAGRLALVGNIDLGSTLVRGTPEEVRQDVRKHIAALAPGGGYVVSSSNTIPNYVPFENYRAMVEAVLEWGRYPIQPA